MAQKTTTLAALKMDDVLYIVGSLCTGLACLALFIMFYILLRKRGSEPSPAYERPAMPLPVPKREALHPIRAEDENDERSVAIGIEEPPSMDPTPFEEDS